VVYCVTMKWAVVSFFIVPFQRELPKVCLSIYYLSFYLNIAAARRPGTKGLVGRRVASRGAKGIWTEAPRVFSFHLFETTKDRLSSGLQSLLSTLNTPLYLVLPLFYDRSLLRSSSSRHRGTLPFFHFVARA